MMVDIGVALRRRNGIGFVDALGASGVGKRKDQVCMCKMIWREKGMKLGAFGGIKT